MAKSRYKKILEKGFSSKRAEKLSRSRTQRYDRDFKVWYDKIDGAPLTYADKRRYQYQIKKITKEFEADQIAEKLAIENQITIRLLYDVSDITIEHFRKWFNIEFFDNRGIHLDGNNLIVPIPNVSWVKLRSCLIAFHNFALIRELLNYFNEDGMDEFFTATYEHFALVTAADHNPEDLVMHRGAENAARMLRKARQQHEKADAAKRKAMEASDFRAIRDTRVRTLSKVGFING